MRPPAIVEPSPTFVFDAAEIAMLIDCDAVCAGIAESLTCATKVYWPATVGMPPIAPLVLSNCNPGGKFPDATLQA